MPKVERWDFGYEGDNFAIVGLEPSLAAISEPVAWRIAQQIHPQNGGWSNIDVLARVREQVSGLDPNSRAYIKTPRGVTSEAREHSIAEGALDFLRRHVGYKVQRLSYEHQLEELLIEIGEISIDASPRLIEATKNEYERQKILEHWHEKAQPTNAADEDILDWLRAGYDEAQQQRQYVAQSELNE
jgi:hypothetical protein